MKEYYGSYPSKGYLSYQQFMFWYIFKTFFHFADNKLLVVDLKYNLGQ